MSHTYEIEIKSLLGPKVNADKLKEAIKSKKYGFSLNNTENQLNHYFNSPKDFKALLSSLRPAVSDEKYTKLSNTLGAAKSISIRTRDTNGKVLLVIKASVGDDTSANGVTRIEWEEQFPNKTIDSLDKLLLEAGCTYQAKWSRSRESYTSSDTTICIDKNAGYGYLAEFERMSEDKSALDKVRQDIISLMDGLGVSELKQDRLERMFAHYNAHWPEYYGTDKTFIVE